MVLIISTGMVTYTTSFFRAFPQGRHLVKRVLDISTGTSIPTCIGTTSGMQPFLLSYPVSEVRERGPLRGFRRPSAMGMWLFCSAAPRTRRAISTRSSGHGLAGFLVRGNPGKIRTWTLSNYGYGWATYRFSGLFCVHLLIPVWYVFHVAGPLNLS